jgi:hypothetical protein
MNRIHVFCLAALVAAVGLLSAQVVSLRATDAQAASRADPIDVMQMMRYAKELPAQAYDAI